MINELLELNELLLQDMPGYQEQSKQFNNTISEQRYLLRSLMNVRPPMPISDRFIELQDKLLAEEVIEKGIVSLNELTSISKNIYLWQGDITRLQVDAIVNAANKDLLGCFLPHHKCIDNAIHSAAGVQLRQACYDIMQNKKEQTGNAKITSAYNLPSKYIIHTVGPIVKSELTKKDCALLKKCYQSCLDIAIKNHLKSIAFCCISTGEFKFPNQEAGEIAVTTVKEFLQYKEIEVIFNVFKEIDYKIYNELLRKN